MKSCRNHGRRACLWCAGTTLAFPLEHAIWEKMPLFRHAATILGL
jgi:hypothetical protein